MRQIGCDNQYPCLSMYLELKRTNYAEYVHGELRWQLGCKLSGNSMCLQRDYRGRNSEQIKIVGIVGKRVVENKRGHFNSGMQHVVLT